VSSEAKRETLLVAAATAPVGSAFAPGPPMKKRVRDLSVCAHEAGHEQKGAPAQAKGPFALAAPDNPGRAWEGARGWYPEGRETRESRARRPVSYWYDGS